LLSQAFHIALPRMSAACSRSYSSRMPDYPRLPADYGKCITRGSISRGGFRWQPEPVIRKMPCGSPQWPADAPGPYTSNADQPGVCNVSSSSCGAALRHSPGVVNIGTVPDKPLTTRTWHQATLDQRLLTSEALCPPILVWHCTHPHGLFSCFSLAMGHMDKCLREGHLLVIDWSSAEMLYRGPPGCRNLWEAFFCQPAEVSWGVNPLGDARLAARVTETDRPSYVFGAYRGVIEVYGPITPDIAFYGRYLCRRYLRLSNSFAGHVARMRQQLLGQGRRWLAVHIRRADKGIEAASNLALNETAIVARIYLQCAVWHCSGVFLCTDDSTLKQNLKLRLAADPVCLAVSTYPSDLPSSEGQAVHFDPSLDSYKKAEDVVSEVMLMAQGCHGLLSTYSNVSAAVVYLSPEGYPFTTFWEPITRAGDIVYSGSDGADSACHVAASAA